MTSSSHWQAYTDGGSRGNPGPAGCGAHIIDPNGAEHPFYKYLGKMTNNQAEYSGLLLALEELKNLGATQVLIRADSELMVKQMRGEYRVKNPNILPLFQKAKQLAKEFADIKFEHVRREFNKEADRLANVAIDEGVL
ncbi:MAG: ribonuclease HI family protein [Deltaproteobacteria bacterium]|nr:ribonuclease HI family protein [Deltaproteobacteria bacterium]